MSEQRKKSRYAEKRDRGDMMYGPGCCAHNITKEQIEKRKEQARLEGHKFWTPGWAPKSRTDNPDIYTASTKRMQGSPIVKR